MTDRVESTLTKWPFLMGDGLLVGVAAVLVLRGGVPLSLPEAAICFLAVFAGAGLGVWPYLREHAARFKRSETDALVDTVSRMGNLEQIKQQIQDATAQWPLVQEQSSQTVKAAQQITERIQQELEQFCAFLKNAQDTEKDHLRLELDKLRGVERDWLQATVLILDHIFALNAAGARSGQPALVAQLGQFQFACRDAVRRVGLVGFSPAVNDLFDPQAHQPEKAGVTPEPTARVVQVLALGYTYRGEMVRRALVRLSAGDLVV